MIWNVVGGYTPVWLGLLRVVGRVAYRSAVGVCALLHVDAHGGVDAADFIYNVSGARVFAGHTEMPVALLHHAKDGTGSGIIHSQLAVFH